MRNRITITLKDDVIKEVDKLINDLTIRSRSQAIEYLLSKAISNYKIDSVLILAGGPSTGFPNRIHKCMQIVKGKPILENIILYLKEKEIKNFVFACDNMSNQVTSYFSDGKRLGIDIKYAISEESKGLASSIKMAKNFFDKTFLIWYGDTLCKFDLADMIRVHKDSKALATIALTTVSNPLDYGIVKMHGSRIIDFIEKPKKRVAESYLVSSGIFLAEPEIFNYINANMRSLELDLFSKLAKKNLLVGYPFEGIWLNINNKNELQKANVLWKT
jgi:NDP-sugar pyrophosphorylase family protein